MKIHAYKNSSKSARALADALGVKLLKHEGKVIEDTVLNWGSSHINRRVFGQIINAPDAVARAINKLEAFKRFEGRVVAPSYTESTVEANRWLAEGVTVVARYVLNGHSGKGISIFTPEGAVEGIEEDAPLYTAYIPKDEEYRIHVHAGVAFFKQRKARRKDVPKDKVNWKIRNHDNGFIFAHKDLDVPDFVTTEALRAVDVLGLDFGAVDVMLGKDGKAYVLEVNTACGLEGTTLEKYSEQFERYL